jgi:Family of unknown function (DUF6266)
MAKQRHGILSGFTGKVGNVVGSTWKGMQVLRAASLPKKNRFSKLQIEQQARFMLLSRFLRPISELLDQTFKNAASEMSCFNKAFSINKGTVRGLYPSFKIDYPAVVLSKGSLTNVDDIQVSSFKSGSLQITWTMDKGSKLRGLVSDLLFVAAYCEDLDRWFYKFNFAHRYEGRCNLDFSDFKGRQVHTYMGFISQNGKKTSDSLYLGKLSIS